MAKRVNEIFYSLQGEGFHAGCPAIFVRFSGCNLHCPFCDTDHASGGEMSDDEIIAEVNKYPAELVVLTGGEPSLTIDEALINALHAAGKYIAIETNGTHPLPSGIDWITLSPKSGMAPGGENIVIPHADEIKVVNVGQELSQYLSMPQRGKETKLYLQPCFVENPEECRQIIEDTIRKVKENPEWSLSVQLHRFLQIP